MSRTIGQSSRGYKLSSIGHYDLLSVCVSVRLSACVCICVCVVLTCI
jgi:hypothetical protein